MPRTDSTGISRPALATTAYAAAHSLLATEAMKNVVERTIGTRRRNAFYRPAFNAFAVVSLIGLIGYVLTLPGRRLYKARQPLAGFMRIGQLASVGYLLWTTMNLDVLGFAGVRGLRAILAGRRDVPVEPAAQGPVLDSSGEIQATGPFAHTRQPANFAFVPMMWLNPVMTTKWAAVFAVTTVYAYVGSLHSERLLHDAYGPAYNRYRRRVPMVPGIVRGQ